MTTSAPAERTARSPDSRRLLEFLGGAWAWIFLAILIIFFSFTGKGFLSLTNFQNILANMSILAILAFGQTFVIITAGIDLSTGYIMGMVSVVSALIMRSMAPDIPLWIVILAGLAVGIFAALIAGLVNGLLIARLNVPPFIATLGMFGIARGVGFLLSDGMPVPIMRQGLGRIGNGYLAYFHPEAGWSFLAPPPGLERTQMRELQGILPFVVIIMIVLLVVAHLLLTRTKFGLHTYAVGGNQEAALRAGIPVARHLTMIYLLSALFAAFAGVIYNTRFTNGAANSGEALLLDSIAAVVIGGASLFGGGGTLIGTLIGALIIAVLANGLVILAVNPFWQFIAVGVVIIFAVLIDQAQARVSQG
ncbi:MAG: ribose ABC transporter [Caldilineaceae bacterium]|nr:ABC transporter permease [Caldilineaceae bacterium]MCB9139343.1 ribose ABC transporter [Caldilineaceae bacterium]